MNATSLIASSSSVLTAAAHYIGTLGSGDEGVLGRVASITSIALFAIPLAEWAIPRIRFYSNLLSCDTNVSSGFQILYDTNPDLANERNLDVLIASGANANQVAGGLRTLRAANPDIVTQQNFDALIAKRSECLGGRRRTWGLACSQP